MRAIRKIRSFPLLAAAIAALAVALMAGTAQAAPLRASAEFDESASGPALGDGYLYWARTSYHGSGSGRRLTSTIYQRRIADGQTRIVMKGSQTAVAALFVTGGRVGFGLTRFKRTASHKKPGLYTDEIFAMAHGDPAPTLVRSGDHKMTLSVSVRHKNGHRITYESANECGDENNLKAIDGSGQMLIDETSKPCAGGKRVSASHIYSIGGATPVSVTGIRDSFVTYLEFGKLVTTPENFVVVRDVATGQSIKHPAEMFTDQVAIDAAGNFATVSTVWVPRKKSSGAWSSAIRIFRPGQKKFVAQIIEPALSVPSVVMCAGGVVEITQVKGQTRMKLALRNLDGSLVRRVDGPTGIFVYDAACEGRHLTVATQELSEPPKTYQYDL